MPRLTFRDATLADIPPMQVIRNAVKENVLSDPKLVTDRDYEKYIQVKGSSWVCERDNHLVGFAIADLAENNVWALFVDPAFESKGIGKKLLTLILNWYFNQTQHPIWLSTEANTRAETFYRKQGWQQTGFHKSEIKFEMTYEDWAKQVVI